MCGSVEFGGHLTELLVLPAGLEGSGGMVTSRLGDSAHLAPFAYSMQLAHLAQVNAKGVWNHRDRERGVRPPQSGPGEFRGDGAT